MAARLRRGFREGMAASCPPSAPSTGGSVPQGSRLQLGAGCRVPEEAGRPFSHVQFPPFWGVHRPAPAAQPRSGDVLNQRLAAGRELCSETRLAFPEKPLEPVAPVVPPASCVRMHADPRIRVLTSTTRENYPCPDVSPQRPALPKAQEWSDNVLCGDREKIRLPPSVYTFSYPAHEIQPVARARHVYRGELSSQSKGLWGFLVAWLRGTLRIIKAVTTIWVFSFLIS